MDDLFSRLENALKDRYLPAVYTKTKPYFHTEGRCDLVELAGLLLHDPDFDTDRLLKILLAEWLLDKWHRVYEADIIKKYTRQIAGER